MSLRIAIVAAALTVSAAPALAAYLPVGPQKDVNIATVTGGGWSLCY